MPELPDVTVYVEALGARVTGARLERVRLASPFVVRSFDPPIAEANGRTVAGLRRVGKRIVIALEGDLFLSIHLMIAGRLHWKPPGTKVPGKLGLAALDFSTGTLTLTEAGTKKRAAIHLLKGEAAIVALDAGGVEPLACTEAEFSDAITRENHTLKRALTDPHILSGIGNAYSDEILHRARLSPVRQTRALSDGEHSRLYDATRATLYDWIVRLRQAAGSEFPEGVTAFRPDMAVHGRYGKPCPDCGAPVQRIRHADNETNYCAKCQTGGKLLADRSLSRLLRADWPRTLEEMEERRGQASQSKMGGPTRRGHS
ncbi:MAG TPA: DNA-formamidopyrimidine glycosylase family protein [Methylomirabilota bacterium]